ncbi:SR-related and CTD-associated factor 8 isoform X2 [Chironomus tepperi]|uniref:SR-related and CTD-associated factor 8 isoform X2 n=1 Tax=Chironomus tepperi TaxID=113505 RepID=UPI00391FA47A
MDNAAKSMEPVHNFTNELFSLYDFKVPISKAKMGAITKSAMKAIKFYKHVVQNVEKFILKCKPEYKIPGLYVIDSIVRQSRHQFGPEKDVFAPRFARNMEETFAHLFRCSQEDKSKIIRVLNLWQKNNVFAPEVIQPLFDLANPDHPVHQNFLAQQQQNQQQNDMSALSNGMNIVRESPLQKDDSNTEMLNATNLQKFQFQQMMMQQSAEQMGNSAESMKFKQLLEYDYGSENEEDKNDAAQSAALQQYQANAMSGLPYQFTKCLEDPNILKQLQSINKMDVQRYLQEMPAASNSTEQQPLQGSGITLANINSLRGPQTLIDISKDQDVELVGEPEVIPIDVSSRSPTPTRHKRRRSRSHSRERYGRRRRSRSTRSRSRSPRNRRRSSRDRTKEKEREKQREIDKERRRKGLPDIKKEHLSVCSTTLWVGHLSKLVQQEELSDTFGKYGDIISIDMIPPRGCAYIVMNRRQDAHKAMQALKNHKLQNRAITISWAAGKGVKGKEWKDYFDQTLGVTYIPYTKLTQGTDFESLEEGGMYDEETMPSWVKEKMKQPQQPVVKETPIILPQFFGMPTNVSNIDTSQPPPNAPLLPTMPPFPLTGLPRLMMPNVLPLGIPPPNMLGMVFPPTTLDKTSVPPPNLMGFNLGTAPNQQSSSNITSNTSGDDHMDIEMEDEQHTTKSNDAAILQQFYQPPPSLSSLMMQANQSASNVMQNQNSNNSNNSDSQNDDFSRLRDSRNNRSQSREKDRNDYRRGSRPDYNNRSSRWPNDSNSRDNRDNRRDNNGRSRDGGSQNNYSRRSGHQQDIPSLLSQPPMENDNLPPRQRNNDFNSSRDEYNDRRQPYPNRGFNNQPRGGRGNGPAFRGNFGGRGFNNNFNDRGGFHDRDANQRGGRRNWNDNDNDRRGGSFPPRGGFDRTNRSKRWGNSRERDEYDSSEQNEQDNTEQHQQESKNENFENNDEQESSQVNEELPPGTENYEEPSMVEDHHPKGSFDNSNSEPQEQEQHQHQHQQEFNEEVPAENHNSSSVNESAVEENNQGNTTPLCDEAKE